MPYEPLHHKYRPQTFADLVGQETITLTLSNALKQARIAPAYLFTGPRGTGKTSSARILAKSLNCLDSNQPTPDPCGQCEACLAIAKGSALDVMEIDAASNTGVDNIREIIERSRFAPVQCRYKIYAIDECHMLSTAAFNALLKTLEEPPPQVVFILATTDPQRVLSTIISRCQRFDYRRIPLTEMTAHLRYIADREKIAIANDALTLIAQIANGGLRDAESLLDQLSLLPETISVPKVWDLVGAVPEQDLLILLQAINNNNSLAVLEQCRSLLDRGKEPLVVLQNLASFYLNLLIAKTAPQRSEMTTVTETCWQQLSTEAKKWDTSFILRGQQHLKSAETQLKQTTQPRLWLEVTLLGLLPQINTAIANQSTTVGSSPSTPSKSQSVANAQLSSSPTTVTSPTASIDQISHETNITQAPQEPEPKPVAATAPHPVEDKNYSEGEIAVAKAEPNQLNPVATPQSNVKPVASRPTQTPVDNQEIWSKVISCLQPPTTQALVKQQCHLVSFDGISAIVGISSARLQKLNQGKVPNIEAAFAQVCQGKVRVQLEVANAKQNLANNSAKNSVTSIKQSTTEAVQTRVETPPTATALPPQMTPLTVTNEAIKPESLPGQNQIKQTFPPPQERVNPTTASHNPQFGHHQAQTKVKPDTPGLPTSTIPAEDTRVITQTITESDLSPDDADDDLQKAIDNLTQSFEGEVVQMDNMQQQFSEDAEILELPEISQDHHGRPNIEDYEDDW
ncbi:MAG: DNA polymerase III subunit gamma/tau [Cyanobacteria bacterium P01_A01_bin.40]